MDDITIRLIHSVAFGTSASDWETLEIEAARWLLQHAPDSLSMAERQAIDERLAEENAP